MERKYEVPPVMVILGSNRANRIKKSLFLSQCLLQPDGFSWAVYLYNVQQQGCGREHHLYVRSLGVTDGLVSPCRIPRHWPKTTHQAVPLDPLLLAGSM